MKGLFALLGLCSACAAPSTESHKAKPSAAVVLYASSAVRVRVEVARSEAERARGLMFRERLDSDAGMLFLFDESSEHTFWMKNTKIALDMIFISDAMQVVGVVQGAEPFSLEPLSVGVPSRTVLEVNAGFSREHGIAAGTRATFEGVK